MQHWFEAKGQVIATRKGQLDFISRERKRPVAPAVCSTKLITERASTTMQVLRGEIHGQCYDAHSHWRLNE